MSSADVVHYHLIHNGVVSLLDIPSLFGRRATVWTIHDPWPMTGHCIYPVECQQWTEGCEQCPSLDYHFPMREDYARQMWRIKKSVFSQIDPDVVVASRFMLDMVRRSPLLSHLQRVHLIPFGVDTTAYLPEEERTHSRQMLGVRDDDFVIFFRSTPSAVKGLSYILNALDSSPPLRPTTLLTVDSPGLTASLAEHYHLRDMGWIDDENLYARLLSACDLLLMPSTAEAFGLMAVEAMAAGRPVICFEGTSLPSVTYAPECGIAVPWGDSSALRHAIDGLSSNPREATRRGQLGRILAAEHYDHERYLDDLARLYRSAGVHVH